MNISQINVVVNTHFSTMSLIEPAMLLVRTGRDPFGKKVTSAGSILKKILLENRFLSIGRVVFYFTAYFCFL